jgi:hypothetical protein
MFACGGLGRHSDDLGARLLFLPSDPETDVVPLDKDTMTWLKQVRPAPYDGQAPSWGHQERATSHALVLYDQRRDDAGWSRYLALHRHGGIEVGLGRLPYEQHNVQIVPLRRIVGIAWAAAALQAEAIQQWQVDGPFEVTVGLRNTAQATLGDFAEGWATPGNGLYDYPLCLDDHVLLRHETLGPIDPEHFAISLGDRLEQTFGTTNRRHLASRGQYEGKFDPRFW